MVTGKGLPYCSSIAVACCADASGRVVVRAGGPGIRSLAHARGRIWMVRLSRGVNRVFGAPALWSPRMGPPIGHPIRLPEWRWGWLGEPNAMLKLMGVCGAPTGVAMRCRKRAVVRQTCRWRCCSGRRRSPSLASALDLIVVPHLVYKSRESLLVSICMAARRIDATR